MKKSEDLEIRKVGYSEGLRIAWLSWSHFLLDINIETIYSKFSYTPQTKTQFSWVMKDQMVKCFMWRFRVKAYLWTRGIFFHFFKGWTPRTRLSFSLHHNSILSFFLQFNVSWCATVASVVPGQSAKRIYWSDSTLSLTKPLWTLYLKKENQNQSHWRPVYRSTDILQQLHLQLLLQWC